MDEETLRAVAGVLEADNNIRASVINNLISSGEKGIEEMAYEISKRLSNRYGIDLGARKVASVLAKPFEWGMERFMVDYDQNPLVQDDMFNKEGNVDDNSVENANIRTRHVANMISALDCRGSNQNYYWQDFAGRGYNAIRDSILYEFGENAANKFDYYEWHDLRDELKVGIRMTLNRVHDASIGEVSNLHYATRRLDGVVEQHRQTQQEEHLLSDDLPRSIL